MNEYLRAWLHNLWVTAAIIVGVALFFLLFMRIFYPDSISAMLMMLQFTAALVAGLNLWPIVGLAIAVSLLSSTLPRRKQRDD